MEMIGIKLASLLLAVLFCLTRNVALGHDFPIIGILAQEQTDGVVRELHPQANTYIYATYIKAIESAGGRVLPILTGKNESYYRKIMSSINGVVIPGGNATLAPDHPYYDTAATVYDIALQLNERGIYFPVFGVCLGFEFLAQYASRDANFLKRCPLDFEVLPLRFTLPPRETTLFARLRLDQFYTLQYTNSTANLHSWCVMADDFRENALLENDWKITALSSISHEHKQVEFVASLEHKRYPIYGVQFHPEVIAFEWSNPKKYPRAERKISANTYLYETTVHYARKNDQTFGSEQNGEDESDLLIYNYPVQYTLCSSGKQFHGDEMSTSPLANPETPTAPRKMRAVKKKEDRV